MGILCLIQRGTLTPYFQRGTINRWLILSQGCCGVLEASQRRSKVWTHKSKKTNQSTLYFFSFFNLLLWRLLRTLLAFSQSASWGKSPAMFFCFFFSPTVLKECPEVPRTCWTLFLHSAVQLIPNHQKCGNKSEIKHVLWFVLHRFVHYMIPYVVLHSFDVFSVTSGHLSLKWVISRDLCWEGLAVWFNELSFKRDEDISPCFYPLLFATYSTFDFLLNTRHYLFYFHVTSLCYSLPLFLKFILLLSLSNYPCV